MSSTRHGCLVVSHRQSRTIRRTEKLRMTIEQLTACTKKDLAERARKLGIAGCHSMTKDDLVKANSRALKRQEKAKEKEQAKPANATPKISGNAAPPVKPNGKVVQKPLKASKIEPI